MVTTTDWQSGCVSRSLADHVHAGPVGQAQIHQRQVEAQALTPAPARRARARLP
jgi:hypothetical protein